MTQLELASVAEALPRRLFSCSPARLAAWLDCPRRYRMSYLDRPRPPSRRGWAHQSLGASVHNALRAWWDLPRARRTPTAAGALLHAGWLPEGFRDAAQSDTWRQQARGMVEGYVATLDPDDEPVGLERVVGLRTATLALSGRVDRIDARGDELVVVDYKTGRHLLTTDDARGSLALAVYARATERVLHRPCRRVELHHLPSGQVLGWEHRPDALARQLRRIEEIAAEAHAAEEAVTNGADRDALFPARAGPRCGWCDFASLCPAGRAAATPQDSWAGLGEVG